MKYSATIKRKLANPFFCAQILLLCALVAFPLLYSTAYIEPVVSLRMFLFSFVGIAIWLLLLFPHSKVSFTFSGLMRGFVYCFLAYAFWILLGVFYALNWQASLFEFGRLLLILNLCVFLYIFQINNPDFFNWLAISFCISAIAQCIICIAQYHHIWWLPQPPSGGHAAGVFINRTILSSYIGFCLFFALYTILRKHRLWRIVGIISLTLIAYTSAIAQTRAATLGIVGGLAILFLLLIIKEKTRRKKILTFGIVALVVTTICSAALLSISSDLRKAVSSKFNITEFIGKSNRNMQSSSSTIRLITWNKTIKLWKDNPIIGVGFGNWKVHIANYGTDDIVWFICDRFPFLIVD